MPPVIRGFQPCMLKPELCIRQSSKYAFHVRTCAHAFHVLGGASKLLYGVPIDEANENKVQNAGEIPNFGPKNLMTRAPES